MFSLFLCALFPVAGLVFLVRWMQQDRGWLPSAYDLQNRGAARCDDLRAAEADYIMRTSSVG